MSMVAMTPFSALLTLFFAVPLGIIISIYSVESATAYRHRHAKSKLPL